MNILKQNKRDCFKKHSCTVQAVVRTKETILYREYLSVKWERSRDCVKTSVFDTATIDAREKTSFLTFFQKLISKINEF